MFIEICIIIEIILLISFMISKKKLLMKKLLRFLGHGALVGVMIYLFIIDNGVIRGQFLFQGLGKFFLLGAIVLSVLNEFFYRKHRIGQKTEA